MKMRDATVVIDAMIAKLPDGKMRRFTAALERIKSNAHYVPPEQQWSVWADVQKAFLDAVDSSDKPKSELEWYHPVGRLLAGLDEPEPKPTRLDEWPETAPEGEWVYHDADGVPYASGAVGRFKATSTGVSSFKTPRAWFLEKEFEVGEYFLQAL